jgi:erythromycin esterase-like protein
MAWRRTKSDRGEHVNDAANLSAGLARIARPLETARDLDPLLDLIADARFVLLGEASHGTSEFYTWSTEISTRLIQERGFSFIAVEGDWPDCYRVNRYVKAMEHSGGSAEAVLHAFERWPTWMWANPTIALSTGRRARVSDRRIGFYGLDVYSLWDSMRGVTEFLQRVDPELAAAAKRAYRCFEPYAEDAQEYARATALVPTSCEDEAVSVLRELRANAPRFAHDGASRSSTPSKTLVARNAELYYRTMIPAVGVGNVRTTRWSKRSSGWRASRVCVEGDRLGTHTTSANNTIWRVGNGHRRTAVQHARRDGVVPWDLGRTAAP